MFNSVVLFKAPPDYKVRRNLEVSNIALLKLTLDEQKDFGILTLCRNDVT